MQVVSVCGPEGNWLGSGTGALASPGETAGQGHGVKALCMVHNSNLRWGSRILQRRSMIRIEPK